MANFQIPRNSPMTTVGQPAANADKPQAKAVQPVFGAASSGRNCVWAGSNTPRTSDLLRSIFDAHEPMGPVVDEARAALRLNE